MADERPLPIATWLATLMIAFTFGAYVGRSTAPEKRVYGMGEIRMACPWSGGNQDLFCVRDNGCTVTVRDIIFDLSDSLEAMGAASATNP